MLLFVDCMIKHGQLLPKTIKVVVTKTKIKSFPSREWHPQRCLVWTIDSIQLARQKQSTQQWTNLCWCVEQPAKNLHQWFAPACLF